MTDSLIHDYAMKALRHASLVRQAQSIMESESGLGEMQAYRVAQMQRAMRGMNKKTR